ITFKYVDDHPDQDRMGMTGIKIWCSNYDYDTRNRHDEYTMGVEREEGEWLAASGEFHTPIPGIKVYWQDRQGTRTDDQGIQFIWAQHELWNDKKDLHSYPPLPTMGF